MIGGATLYQSQQSVAIVRDRQIRGDREEVRTETVALPRPSESA